MPSFSVYDSGTTGSKSNKENQKRDSNGEQTRSPSKASIQNLTLEKDPPLRKPRKRNKQLAAKIIKLPAAKKKTKLMFGQSNMMMVQAQHISP